MAKVEAELEEVKAKIAALEAKIEFYEHATRNKRRLTSKPDRDDDEEDTLQNLERFLARPLDEQGKFLDGLQGTLKELQHKENLLLEKEAALRRESESGREERDAKRRRLDNPTFVAECLSKERAFVAARGPEAPWDELVGELPDLPLGSAHEAGMSGACEDNAGLVTAELTVFLSKGKRLVTECNGEITVDVCLSCLFDACSSGTTSIHFNKASESSHGAGNKSKLRDTRFVMHGFDVVRGESKELSGDLKVARKELTDKMRPWSAAYYGDLPGILGIAAGGPPVRGHLYREGWGQSQAGLGIFW